MFELLPKESSTSSSEFKGNDDENNGSDLDTGLKIREFVNSKYGDM